MTASKLFQAANIIALAGWISLVASPVLPRLADRMAGCIVPVLLSIAYTGLILAFWSRGQGGFGSLAGVAQLFQTPELLLAGWLHYLAFDLWIGAWQVRTARREGLPSLLLVPCLPLTFLFGPVGLLAFLTLRRAMNWTRLARAA